MKAALAPRPILFPSGPLPWLKPAVFTGSLVPLVALTLGAARGTLGANAIERALNQLGFLALTFLVASLASTPLKTLTGWTWPIRIRKMLGLFAAFYAGLHLCTYAALDQGLEVKAIWKDITERKFIWLGFLAFLLLVPLAITSTSGMLKRLGFTWWKRLHRLAYVAAALGVIHFVLRVKKDLTEPAIYGVILGLLFAVRMGSYLRARLARGRAGSKPSTAASGR
jgi:sulfoxide reductase heme-binding subunit YedZ